MQKIKVRRFVEIELGEITNPKVVDYLVYKLDGIGHEEKTFYIDWDDIEEDDLILTVYLELTYGEDITLYNEFLVKSV